MSMYVSRRRRGYWRVLRHGRAPRTELLGMCGARLPSRLLPLFSSVALSGTFEFPRPECLYAVGRWQLSSIAESKAFLGSRCPARLLAGMLRFGGVGIKLISKGHGMSHKDEQVSEVDLVVFNNERTPI